MRFATGVLRAAAAALAAGALVLSGCSSAGVDATGGTAITAAKSTTTPTLITDAPSEEVLALGLTVTGIRMFTASGSYADVLTSPANIEAVHLDAVQEPLRSPLSVPQGTYTSATITVSNPVVTFVDPTTKTVVHTAATLEAGSTTVTFSTPITVSTTSNPIVFDLLVGRSVAISGTTATVTPTFDVRQVQVSDHPTGPNNGLMCGVVGTVVSVSGTTLTIAEPNGTQVSVTTNSTTELQGFSALTSLTAGEIVDVDVAHQTDGTLLAKRIHVVPVPAGDYLVGPVTSTTGTPVTSFAMVLRQALGAGLTNEPAGTSFTVAVNGSTTFELAPQATSLPSLPFTPAFVASTIFAGQNVAVEASSVSGTTTTANSVTLLPQTVGGTVSAVTSVGGLTTYTVTLGSDSTLATLTGATSVVVYEYSATQNASASTTLSVGSTIRANGLLFKDNGTLRMVARLRADGAQEAPSQHH